MATLGELVDASVADLRQAITNVDWKVSQLMKMQESKGPQSSVPLMFSEEWEADEVNEANWRHVRPANGDVSIATWGGVRCTLTQLGNGDGTPFGWTKRAARELRLKNPARFLHGQNRWLATLLALPAGDVSTGHREVSHQFYPKPDPKDEIKGRNPPVTIFARNHQLFTHIRGDAAPVTKDRDFDSNSGELLLGDFQPGMWHKLIMHIKWSYESNGVTEIWLNGELTRYSKANMYNDQDGTYLKRGLYIPGWGSDDTPNLKQIYHGPLFVASGNVTYEMMDSLLENFV